ncbi:MAG: hypothetical protein IPM91_20825 [Bacteroidetes bacterium]|nr:hypothetical protein [Bacteroidota bacterium]
MNRIACLSLAILAFLFSSCSSEVDGTEAKKIVEQLLTDLKNEKYDGLDTYYTSSSNRSEPLQAKMEKFIRLQDTTGPIESFEYVSEDKKYDEASGYNQLTLIYKVVCSRVVLKETFILVKDEGKTGIIFQNTENWPEEQNK